MYQLKKLKYQQNGKKREIRAFDISIPTKYYAT